MILAHNMSRSVWSVALLFHLPCVRWTLTPMNDSIIISHNLSSIHSHHSLADPSYVHVVNNNVHHNWYRVRVLFEPAWSIGTTIQGSLEVLIASLVASPLPLHNARFVPKHVYSYYTHS